MVIRPVGGLAGGPAILGRSPGRGRSRCGSGGSSARPAARRSSGRAASPPPRSAGRSACPSARPGRGPREESGGTAPRPAPSAVPASCPGACLPDPLQRLERPGPGPDPLEVAEPLEPVGQDGQLAGHPHQLVELPGIDPDPRPPPPCLRFAGSARRGRTGPVLGGAGIPGRRSLDGDLPRIAQEEEDLLDLAGRRGRPQVDRPGEAAILRVQVSSGGTPLPLGLDDGRAQLAKLVEHPEGVDALAEQVGARGQADRSRSVRRRAARPELAEASGRGPREARRLETRPGPRRGWASHPWHPMIRAPGRRLPAAPAGRHRARSVGLRPRPRRPGPGNPSPASRAEMTSGPTASPPPRTRSRTASTAWVNLAIAARPTIPAAPLRVWAARKVRSRCARSSWRASRSMRPDSRAWSSSRASSKNRLRKRSFATVSPAPRKPRGRLVQAGRSSSAIGSARPGPARPSVEAQTSGTRDRRDGLPDEAPRGDRRDQQLHAGQVPGTRRRQVEPQPVPRRSADEQGLAPSRDLARASPGRR